MYIPSIFNDVLGPVMTGPSSSHTAGPWRIAYSLSSLAENIEKLEVIFPKTSSYAGVYRGQKSDVAIIAGTLKMTIDDPNFKNSYAVAEKNKLLVDFKIEDINSHHPNTAIFKIYSKEKYIEAVTMSTGGGTFVIQSILGEEVNIKGYEHYIFIFGNSQRDEFEKITKDFLYDNNISFIEIQKNIHFIRLKINKEISENLLDKLNNAGTLYNSYVRYMPPVLPVPSFNEINVPFSTAKEAVEYCEKNNISFAEAAVKYECQRGNITEEFVYNFAEYIFSTIEKSISKSITDDIEKISILTPSAKKMYKNISFTETINSGIIEKACIYATGIMEVNSSMGVVVASPTAGSCGVLGGVLKSLYETKKYTRKQIIDAMLCAGLCGIFIANNATFAAEVCGCQAEVGSASAMTAAAVSYLLNSSAENCCKSASMAMQNMLGLVCDPVAGCADIPCISRNTAGVANAVMSANMTKLGFDSVIPFDEVISAMFSVGTMLPSELRCTRLGGLCITPTAKIIETEYVSK